MEGQTSTETGAVGSSINVKIQLVQDVKELQELNGEEWVRCIGMLYFQKLGDGYIPRVISEATNGQWIRQKVKEGKIYVPIEKVKAELG